MPHPKDMAQRVASRWLLEKRMYDRMRRVARHPINITRDLKDAQRMTLYLMDIVIDYDAPPHIQKSTEESRDHVLRQLGDVIERLEEFPEVQAEYAKVMRQHKRSRGRKDVSVASLSAALMRALQEAKRMDRTSGEKTASARDWMKQQGATFVEFGPRSTVLIYEMPDGTFTVIRSIGHNEELVSTRTLREARKEAKRLAEKPLV